jgi:enoyl-CoA hydratase/carnithine racemase
VTYSEIQYDVSDHIATITLYRPDKLNAFTGTMMNEIIDAFDRTDADDDVHAVIITGSGRGFCAGADLSSGASTFAKGGSDVTDNRGVVRDGGGLLTLRIFRSLKPVIGAINGAAVGVGVTMTLPMDIRIASDAAKFGFVFAKRGIVPEACSSWFLPRLVGISQAAEWVYTGRVFSAQEALDGGLIRSIHAPDDLLPTATSRLMLWRMMGASHPMEAHRVDSRGIMERGRSNDSKEGVTSFLEKRPAVYPDKVSDGIPDIFPDWVEPEFH